MDKLFLWAAEAIRSGNASFPQPLSHYLQANERKFRVFTYIRSFGGTLAVVVFVLGVLVHQNPLLLVFIPATILWIVGEFYRNSTLEGFLEYWKLYSSSCEILGLGPQEFCALSQEEQARLVRRRLDILLVRIDSANESKSVYREENISDAEEAFNNTYKTFLNADLLNIEMRSIGQVDFGL